MALNAIAPLAEEETVLDLDVISQTLITLLEQNISLPIIVTTLRTYGFDAHEVVTLSTVSAEEIFGLPDHEINDEPAELELSHPVAASHVSISFLIVYIENNVLTLPWIIEAGMYSRLFDLIDDANLEEEEDEYDQTDS